MGKLGFCDIITAFQSCGKIRCNVASFSNIISDCLRPDKWIRPEFFPRRKIVVVLLVKCIKSTSRLFNARDEKILFVLLKEIKSITYII